VISLNAYVAGHFTEFIFVFPKMVTVYVAAMFTLKSLCAHIKENF